VVTTGNRYMDRIIRQIVIGYREVMDY